MKGLLLPEPTYKGPENIVYFRDNNFTEEISRDKNVVWMVTFYAAWSPACIDFASIFSKLSSEYGLPNLKFGKVSWRERKYDIDGSAQYEWDISPINYSLSSPIVYHYHPNHP